MSLRIRSQVLQSFILLNCVVFFQINRVSSWIDGSFIYSTSEAWVNAMRSFQNGTFLSEDTGKWPVRNIQRVPLFNQPVPNVLRTLSPERLFCQYKYLQILTNSTLEEIILKTLKNLLYHKICISVPFQQQFLTLITQQSMFI